MQVPAPGQDAEFSASLDGAPLAVCQDVPFQVMGVPGMGSSETARQLAALAQDTLSTKRLLPGTECQDVPFQVMALELNPASMQNVTVGHEMPLSAGNELVPDATSSETVHAVPFHSSATKLVWQSLMHVLLMAHPDAMQMAPEQETLVKATVWPVIPALVVFHVLPFHAIATSSPLTITQLSWLVQDTLERSARPCVAGMLVTCHVLPSHHCACGSPAAEVPDAMQKDAVGHDSAGGKLLTLVTVGAAMTVQAVPFHSSASGSGAPSGLAVPAATQSVVLGHEIMSKSSTLVTRN